MIKFNLNATPKETQFWGKTQFDNIMYLLDPFEDERVSDNFEQNNKDYTFFAQFAYNDTTDTEGRFHGYAGSYRISTKLEYYDSDTYSFLFDLDVPSVDLYITKNGFMKPYNRSKATLFSLYNVVLDFDCHNTTLSPEELQKHIRTIGPKIAKSLVITPNFIHYTGRGLHLWYCVEPAAASLMPLFNAFIERLLKNASDVLASLNESILELDEKATKNLPGIIRLPYTYNSKAGSWSDGVMLHKDRKNIGKLIDLLDKADYHCYTYTNKAKQQRFEEFRKKYIYEEIYKDRQIKKAQQKEKRQKKINEKRKYHKTKYIPCLVHRKNFLWWLFSTHKVEEGRRTMCLFALYDTCRGLYESQEAAQDIVFSANNTLTSPLSDKEIESIFKSYDKKMYYFKNETFLEFIKATPEEINRYETYTAKKAKSDAAYRKKEERDLKIWNLHDEGKNPTEIARELKISRPTVYKVLSQIAF